jgi:hypothetical protein
VQMSGIEKQVFCLTVGLLRVEDIVTCMRVTIDGVLIGNQIYLNF